MRVAHYLAYTLEMVDEMSFGDIADVLGVMEGDEAVANLKKKDKNKKGSRMLSG